MIYRRVFGTGSCARCSLNDTIEQPEVKFNTGLDFTTFTSRMHWPHAVHRFDNFGGGSTRATQCVGCGLWNLAEFEYKQF